MSYDRTVHGNEGEAVTLDVKVSGNPPPSITWFHGERKVEGDNTVTLTENHSLFFRCLDVTHAGTYTFMASNSAGGVPGEVELVVNPRKGGRSRQRSREELEEGSVQVEKFRAYVFSLHAQNNQGFITSFEV